MRGALMASAALLAFSGCSLGADDEKGKTEPASGAPKHVAAIVRAPGRAARKGAWRTGSRRPFTAVARERAGGRDCVRLVNSSAGDLRGARIELVGIEVSK